MSYNKTNWVSGDIITAQKLNNIEEGIESVAGPNSIINTLVITVTAQEYTPDRSLDSQSLSVQSITPSINELFSGNIKYCDFDDIIIKLNEITNNPWGKTTSIFYIPAAIEYFLPDTPIPMAISGTIISGNSVKHQVILGANATDLIVEWK